MAKAYEVANCKMCPHCNTDYEFSKSGDGYTMSLHCRSLGKPLSKQTMISGEIPDWCPLPDMPKKEGG